MQTRLRVCLRAANALRSSCSFFFLCDFESNSFVDVSELKTCALMVVYPPTTIMKFGARLNVENVRFVHRSSHSQTFSTKLLGEQVPLLFGSNLPNRNQIKLSLSLRTRAQNSISAPRPNLRAPTKPIARTCPTGQQRVRDPSVRLLTSIRPSDRSSARLFALIGANRLFAWSSSSSSSTLLSLELGNGFQFGTCARDRSAPIRSVRMRSTRRAHRAACDCAMRSRRKSRVRVVQRFDGSNFRPN